MKRFVVIVRDAMDNEHSRPEVDAMTHRDAVNQVRGSREWWHWPRGATFTPRLVDQRGYEQHFLDSQSGALLDRMPRITGELA